MATHGHRQLHGHYHKRIRSQFAGSDVTGSFPQLSDKIVIVGGGPAGIHMAHLLHKKGYNNIIILEKEKRVGGKSYTYKYEGIPHEMGTCFLHPMYLELAKLLEELGIPMEYQPGDVDTGDRDIYINDDRIMKDQNRPLTREEYLFAYAEVENLPPGFWWIPDKLMAGVVFNAIVRYKKIHRQIFGHYDFTLPPRPPPKIMAMIDMTLGEFLKVNNLEALIPLFMVGQAAQGYGLLETIPAFYGLSWFTPELFYSYLPKPVGINPRGTALLTMLSKGYSHVWETIVEQDKLQVFTHFNVTSIERGKDGVVIEGKRKHGGSSKHEVIKCDYIFITSPIPETIKKGILKNPTAEEKDIFGRLKHGYLTTTLYESDVQTTPENKCKQIIEYIMHSLSPVNNGKIYAQRHSERCLYPQKTKDFDREKDVWVAYQYCDPVKKKHELNKEQLLKIFHEDMEERGIKVRKVIKQCRWKYFYRFDRESLSKGYLWKILDLQGRNRTFYSGSCCCFESVNDVMNYNLMLIQRFCD